MTPDQVPFETIVIRRKVSSRAKVDGNNRSILPEYRCWTGMIARCTNPGNKSFRRYGGRGINVCDRWLADFENFYRDMGQKPDGRYSIDRIDNDKGYEPGNCRWATPREQVLNRGGSMVAWSGGELSTLRQMYMAHYAAEDIAVALNRTTATIRLRVHFERLHRPAHITRLVKKHKDLHPILIAKGRNAFLSAIQEKGAFIERRAVTESHREAAERATISATICGSDIPRNKKIAALRAKGFNLSEIGDLFGITRERVRQIEALGFDAHEGHATGSDRKIGRTNPAVLKKKIGRLCRAWNAASREARVAFLAAASTAVFDGISAEDCIERPAPKRGEAA